MRLLTLAITTGAIAQVTTLTPVIDKLVTDVGTLSTGIKGYTSGDGGDVLAAGKKLLDDIKSGVTTAKGSSDLTQNDALQLTTPFQGLQTATEGVIKDLVAKKCNFAASGKAADVLSNLQDQMTASKALAEAITSKVPQALQQVAGTLSSGVATALQGGIDSFKDTSSCPAASGGNSSSSAASTSTASTSTAPTSTASTSASSTSAAPTSGPSSSVSATTSSASSAAPPAKPTVSTTASNSTASSTAKASSSTGAASAVSSLPIYAGAAVVAALYYAAF